MFKISRQVVNFIKNMMANWIVELEEDNVEEMKVKRKHRSRHSDDNVEAINETKLDIYRFAVPCHV